MKNSKGKQEAAIKYYEKGLPMLEEILKTIDNSIERRQCKAKIDVYRHNMQKLKNLRTKLNSASSNAFPEIRGVSGTGSLSLTRTHSDSSKSKRKNAGGSKRNSFGSAAGNEDILFEPHFNHFRKHSGTIKIITVNSQTSLTLPSKDGPLGADGGALFQIICSGKLTISTIADCDTKDLYHTLGV
ncbi:hypothetical protein RFI_33708, partial [Reticulomyxa filosa]